MDKKDAIKCLKSIQKWVPDWDDREDGLSYLDAIDMAIAALDTPNESLTLEQLREMNGEPVWVNSIRLWGIVRVYSYGIRVLTKSGEFDITRMKIYRRPPEGEA